MITEDREKSKIGDRIVKPDKDKDDKQQLKVYVEVKPNQDKDDRIGQ